MNNNSPIGGNLERSYSSPNLLQVYKFIIIKICYKGYSVSKILFSLK